MHAARPGPEVRWRLELAPGRCTHVCLWATGLDGKPLNRSPEGIQGLQRSTWGNGPWHTNACLFTGPMGQPL